MKKILLAAVVSSIFSTGAFAAACTYTNTGVAASAIATPAANTEQCACDGGTAQKTAVNGGPGAIVGTPIFIRTGFDVQCSSNTIVSYNEFSGVLFAVAAGSAKGNQLFGGNTNGGAVVASSTACTSSTKSCVATDITGELGRAVTAGGGS